MKCPYCKKDINIPFSISLFMVGVVSAFALCPKCMGKITYTFSGKKVIFFSIPAAFICSLASLYLGESAFLIFPLLILLPAMSLEKWY